MMKEENSEIKMEVLKGFVKVSKITGNEILVQNLLLSLMNLTKDSQWRVREVTFDLIGNMAIEFGQDVFTSKLENIFLLYF